MKKAFSQINLLLIAGAMLFGGSGLEAQWLEGYSHRKKITLNHNLVPGNDPLIGFPCLVSTLILFSEQKSMAEWPGSSDGTGPLLYRSGSSLASWIMRLNPMIRWMAP